jgi:hypothetical protein
MVNSRLTCHKQHRVLRLRQFIARLILQQATLHHQDLIPPTELIQLREIHMHPHNLSLVWQCQRRHNRVNMVPNRRPMVMTMDSLAQTPV